MQQLLDGITPAVFITSFWVLFIAFIIVSILINFRRTQATREVWQTIAMRTGLTLQPGSLLVRPALNGEYRRRALVMNTFTRGTSKSKTVYTRITLSVSNSGGGRLTLSPEGFLSGLGKSLGMQDIPIGSERFDKSFMIRSAPPEFAQTLLGDSMMQDSLLQLKEQASYELSLDGGGLTFTARGVLRDSDFIVSIFNAMSDLADRVEGDIRKPMF